MGGRKGGRSGVAESKESRNGGREGRRFDGMGYDFTERETHCSSGQAVISVKVKHDVNNLRS